MTWTAVALCVACQALIVIGQIALKRAIVAAKPLFFAGGIFCLTIWFFLWLGLMGHWDLSKLFPFEGLNPAMIAIGAWLVLKEKLPATAWVGLVLVCAGVALVVGS